ncbi:arsenic metallochaperone ArsD family protein [Saccharothrix obliqua]|uniref:arsenic metallochaperone ArsD family protein n=1 Tax=Saccharothrix obliqua TaxID=2861747 RepID=UPI001C5CF984|nr:arsenic metallochaperone ArsD family protein [Saccharothrix obliqua]MBW4718727.1 arsenic metallochaperone ArsD family protein [Saccharothrix obliqua]
MADIVQFFDRPCCGPSAASNLADFLRDRVGEGVAVEYHNLNSSGTEPVSVPSSVIGHLSSQGALPVMAVNGQIVAAGSMPNLMDALDLATGRAEAPAGTLTLTLAPGSSGCC